MLKNAERVPSPPLLCIDAVRGVTVVLRIRSKCSQRNCSRNHPRIHPVTHGGQGESLEPPYTRGSISLTLSQNPRRRARGSTASSRNTASRASTTPLPRRAPTPHLLHESSPLFQCAHPLSISATSSTSPAYDPPPARGFHSSTFQLNSSALYGIGGARRGCVARVMGVSGGV